MTADGDGSSVGGIGPAYAACRRRKRAGGGSSEAAATAGGSEYVDVFARGPRAIAQLSKIWRRSKCFSFVLGRREGPPVIQTVGGGGSGSGDGRRGAVADYRYRKSWESLASPALPMAPYTVKSAGESYVPISRRDNEQG